MLKLCNYLPAKPTFFTECHRGKTVQTLNSFFQRTQNMILQIVKQQALLFSQAIEGLVTSLQSTSSGYPQAKSRSIEASSSRTKHFQRNKKPRLASTLSSGKDSFS